MGSRGRGGRGRGRGMSFSVEALGFGVGESLPGPVLAPPSVFPPLVNPPVALRADDKRNSSFSGKVDWDYCVMVKKEIVDWLWDASPFASVIGASGDCSRVTARAPGVADVERYSDRYQLAQVSGNQKDQSCFDWRRLPKELRPGKEGDTGVKPKGLAATSEGRNKRKRKEEKSVAPKKDITKRLAELEQREVHGREEEEGGEGEEEEEGGEKGREKRKAGEEGGGEEEGAEGEEEEEEDEDEEMDDGTDYISSYFDNGEGYLDEDDDGDDGPTY